MYLKQMSLRMRWQQLSLPMPCALQNDIGFVVLEFSESEKYNVSLAYPDAPPHLATDVAEPLLPIEAVRLQAIVTEHLEYLRVTIQPRKC
jgi:hypothetical protein